MARLTRPEPVPYYPMLACHTAPLRPSEAPRDGCRCTVCDHFTHPRKPERWQVVVLSRDPYHGELRRA